MSIGIKSPRPVARRFATDYLISEVTRAEINHVARSLMLDSTQLGAVGLSDFAKVTTTVGSQVCQLSRVRELSSPLTAIATSLVHMLFNRLLDEDPVGQEAVYWDVLRRIYERELAMAEGQISKSSTTAAQVRAKEVA